MPNIPDDFGRIGKFGSAEFEELKKALNTAVGDAVKFGAESSKKSDVKDDNNIEKLIEAISEATKIFSDTQEDIKENIESTKKFVEEVKTATDELGKERVSKKAPAVSVGDNLQSAQQTILKNKQKATQDKINQYTSGATALKTSVSVDAGSFQRASGSLPPVGTSSIRENKEAAEGILGTVARMFTLEKLGFRKKGVDRVPAMLQSGELVVSKKDAEGYKNGGFVKPQYLARGTRGSTGTRPMAETANWALGKVGLRISPEIGEPKNLNEASAKLEEVGQNLAGRLNKKFEAQTKKDLAGWASGISTMLMGGGSDLLQNIFAGSVKDATEFRQDMRKLAYELEGITGQERKMQDGFSDIGRTAAETGKRAEVMQRVLLSNVKKGLKNNVEGRKVMKSSLHLSTMIGSNAEQTADMFGEWYRTLGMGADQMSRLANDSRLLARSTGVTGDELVAVMKASEGILKNLRNQGNLTSGAAKNVIETMAMAKKLGIDEQATRMLDAMSSTTKLLNSDDKTKRFVYGNAARMGQGGVKAATEGTLLQDKKLMKGFADQMDIRIQQLTGGKAKNAEEAMTKLSSSERTRISIALDAESGMDLYGYKSFGDSLREGSKTLADRVSDLDAQIKSPAATDEERKVAERQKKDLMMTSAMGKLQEFSTALEKAGKSGESFESALQNSYDKMSQDEREDLKVLEESLSKSDQARIKGLNEPMKAQAVANLSANKKLQEAALAQGKSVKDFGPEIQAALASGDMSAYRKSVAEMDSAMKEFNVDQKMNSDPMTELSKNINKLNDAIRDNLGSLTGRIIDMIGATGILTVQIGLMIAALYSTIGQKFLDFTGLGRLIPKIERIKRPTKLNPEQIIKFKDLTKQGVGSKAAYRQVLDESSTFGKFKKGLGGLARSFDDFFYGPIRNGLDKVARGAEDFIGNMKFLPKTLRETYLNQRKFGGLGLRGGGGVSNSVKEAFKAQGVAFKKGMTAFKNGAIKNIDKLFTGDLMPKSFRKAYTRARSGAFNPKQSIFESVSRGMKSQFKAFGYGLKTKITQLGDDIAEGVVKFGKRLKSGIKGIPGALDNSLNAFTKFSLDVPKKIESSVRFFKSLPGMIWNSIKNIPKLFSGGKGIGNLLEGGISGMFKGLGKGISKAAGFLKGAAKLSPLTLAFAAVDAAFGAVQGWQKAGSTFEGVMKSGIGGMDKLTTGMQVSGAAGGALAGVLDGLLFGFLGLIGVKDGLASFLSYVIYGFGVLGHAIGEGFASWMPTIKKSLDAIGTVFIGIVNAIGGIFGLEGASDMAGAFATLYKILIPVGQVIGWLAGAVFTGLLNTIWAVGKVIETFAHGIRLISAPIRWVVGLIGKMISGIVGWFDWLFNYLVGNSVIPDLCLAIGAFFARMALNVLKGLGGFIFNVIKFFAMLPFKILGFFIKLPFKIMGLMYKAFVKAPLSLLTKLLNFLTGGLFGKALTFLSTKVGEFFSLFKKSLLGLGQTLFDSMYKVANWMTGGWLGKIINGLSSLGSKIVSLVDDWLIKPISNGLSKLAGIFDDYLIKPVTNLLQSLWNKVSGWAGSAASWLGNKTAGATNAAVKVAGTARNAAGTAASWVGDKATTAGKAALDAAKAAGNMAGKAASWVGDKAAVAGKASLDAAKAAGNMAGKAAASVGNVASKAAATVVEVGGEAAAKVGKVAGEAVSVAGKAASWVGDKAVGAGKAAVDVAGKAASAAGSAASWIGGKAASVGSWITEKATGPAIEAAVGMAGKAAGAVGNAAGAAGGFVSKAAGAVGNAAGAAGGFVSKAAGAVGGVASKAAGAVSGMAGNAAGAVGGAAGKALGGVATKIPIIGGLIDFGIRKYMGQDTKKAAVGATGGAVGAGVGAALGAVGGPVGMFVGGIVGQYVGGAIADWWSGAGKKDENVALAEGLGEQAGIDSTIVQQGDAQLAQGDIVVKTMEMAQEPGSMYVHDTHVEEVLFMILDSMGHLIKMNVPGISVKDIPTEATVTEKSSEATSKASEAIGESTQAVEPDVAAPPYAKSDLLQRPPGTYSQLPDGSYVMRGDIPNMAPEGGHRVVPAGYGVEQEATSKASEAMSESANLELKARTRIATMEKDDAFQRDQRILGKGRATERYNTRKSLEEARLKDANAATPDKATEATSKVEPIKSSAETPTTTRVLTENKNAMPDKATEATSKAVEPIKSSVETPATAKALTETKNEDGTYALDLNKDRFKQIVDPMNFIEKHQKQSPEASKYLTGDVAKYLTDDRTEGGDRAIARQENERALEKARMAEARKSMEPSLAKFAPTQTGDIDGQIRKSFEENLLKGKTMKDATKERDTSLASLASIQNANQEISTRFTNKEKIQKDFQSKLAGKSGKEKEALEKERSELLSKEDSAISSLQGKQKAELDTLNKFAEGRQAQISSITTAKGEMVMTESSAHQKIMGRDGKEISGAVDTTGGIVAGWAAAQNVAAAGRGESVGSLEDAMKEVHKSSAVDPAVIEKQAQDTAINAEASKKALDPGSIYVHDIHAEKILKDVMGQVEPGEKKVKEAQDLGSSLIKATKENSQKQHELSQAKQDSAKLAEELPRIPESVYAPINAPEKNPNTMKAMDFLQKEIMNSGLRDSLIPSASSGLNMTDLEDKTINALEASSVAASIPVGEHAIPVARTAEGQEEINSVQPVHLRDITESILRDKTSAQAGTNKLQSDELSRMEEVANQQVAELTQIKEGIQQVVSLLSPKGPSLIAGVSAEQADGRTKDPRRPSHAASFGKMKYGKPGGNANRSLVNNGEC